MPAMLRADLTGDTIRDWLANCSDLVIERPKIGDAEPVVKLSARLEAAMHVPSMILLAPFEGHGALRCRLAAQNAGIR
jgi:hypothetical protein